MSTAWNISVLPIVQASPSSGANCSPKAAFPSRPLMYSAPASAPSVPSPVASMNILALNSKRRSLVSCSARMLTTESASVRTSVMCVFR